MSSYKPWDELSEEERTPEAGYREALRRIEECLKWRSLKLEIDGLGLKEFPPSIEGLEQLVFLNARNNKITEITPIHGLNKLTALALQHNQITDIEVVRNLKELTKINLSDNQITNVEPLSELTNLKWLIIGNNKLDDIKPLSKLNQLTRLLLSGNMIRDITPLRHWLAHIQNFKKGYYGDQVFSIRNNPLSDPPKAVFLQGTQAILDYWEALYKKGQEKNYEGRALIVGRGGVGKTTLLEKLKDERFVLNPKQKQTHGINIWPDCKFPVTGDTEQEFRASIWDFGGQDIQHLTHQYFFTPRTVFILMVNKRGMNTADEATELNYWFRIIDLLGRYSHEKARVMVVQNVFASEGTSAGIDLAPYEERFGDCVDLSFHRVNLGVQEAGFADLRRELHEALLAVPGVGDARVKGWSGIRQALRECRDDRRISFERYAGICTKHGIDTESGQLLLSRYLAQLGELLYYEKGEGALNESLLLDLDWVTKSVYGITGDQTIIDAHGRFREDQIITYWKSIGVDRQRDRKLMLALLQTDAFELCWRTTDKTFLTPTLFHFEETKRPAVRTDLGLRFNYHFLPKGLLGQAIVRLHQYLETPESFWRNGAYLAHDKCRARIARSLSGFEGSSHITIDIEGKVPHSYALLSRISEAFDIIHQTSFPRIRVRREIPCPCKRCTDPKRERYYFSYDRLERDQRTGDKEAYCTNNLSTSIDLLLRGLFKINNPDEVQLAAQIREYLKRDQLKEALEIINKYYPNDDLVIVSANWHQLEQAKIKGILSHEQFALEYNKISDRLLNLLTSLEGQRLGTKKVHKFKPEDEFRKLRKDIHEVRDNHHRHQPPRPQPARIPR